MVGDSFCPACVGTCWLESLGTERVYASVCVLVPLAIDTDKHTSGIEMWEPDLWEGSGVS